MKSRRETIMLGGGMIAAGCFRPAAAQTSLTGKLSTTAGNGPAGVVIGNEADGLAQAASLFTRTGRFALTPGGRMIQPFFNVELVEQVGQTVNERSRGGAVASSSFAISGIDRAAVQEAVDRLYARILGRFKAGGQVLVGRPELETNERGRVISAAMRPSGYTTGTSGGGRSTFYSPTGYGAYFQPGDERFGVGVGPAGMSNGMAEIYVQMQLNAALVGIDVSCRFVDIQTEGGGKYSNLFGSGVASVSGRAGMALVPQATQIWFSPQPLPREGRQRLSLNRPVAPALNPVTEFAEVTSGSTKAQDALGTAIGGLVGGGPSYSTKAYRISLDPAQFPVAMEGCVDGVTAAMIQQLLTLQPAGKR